MILFFELLVHPEVFFSIIVLLIAKNAFFVLKTSMFYIMVFWKTTSFFNQWKTHLHKVVGQCRYVVHTSFFKVTNIKFYPRFSIKMDCKDRIFSKQCYWHALWSRTKYTISLLKPNANVNVIYVCAFLTQALQSLPTSPQATSPRPGSMKRSVDSG